MPNGGGGGGLGLFADLRGAWQERGGGVNEGGEGVETPMNTMVRQQYSFISLTKFTHLQ